MTQEAAVADFAPVAAELRDGRRVTIRAIRPDDADAMGAAFARLSPEARHSRFMMALRELSHSMLQRAVHPVAARELAIVAVAVEGAAEMIVGGARYVTDADNETCEFAVTIANDWHGAGLAWRMMTELVRSARARGLKRMEGYVLARNTPMLDLARRLDFEVMPSDEGPAVRLVRLVLGND